MNLQTVIHRYSVCSHISRVPRSVEVSPIALRTSSVALPLNTILKSPVCCGRSPEFWHYVSGDQAERALALGTNDFPNDR